MEWITRERVKVDQVLPAPNLPRNSRRRSLFSPTPSTSRPRSGRGSEPQTPVASPDGPRPVPDRRRSSRASLASGWNFRSRSTADASICRSSRYSAWPDSLASCYALDSVAVLRAHAEDLISKSLTDASAVLQPAMRPMKRTRKARFLSLVPPNGGRTQFPWTSTPEYRINAKPGEPRRVARFRNRSEL
jgi:hypothetical protein